MNKRSPFPVRLRSTVLVFLTHNMALPVLKLVRRPQPFPYSKEELQAFPEHTIGKELLAFLEQRNLQLLPHYAKHDIKHILLEYDTTDEGEVCLQCFMLGNRHLSFPVLATVLYGILTMPEYWSRFRKAFARGRRSMPIANLDWMGILKDDTRILINKINSHENTPA